MENSYIYYRIAWLLRTNFSIPEQELSYYSNLRTDLLLNTNEINLLLYFIENHYNIQFKHGMEKEITRINQLVKLVSKELDTYLNPAART
ncbi:MAG: hypothetical protein ACLFNU_02675 [Bacteroidales bacterium]